MPLIEVVVGIISVAFILAIISGARSGRQSGYAPKTSPKIDETKPIANPSKWSK